MSLAALSGPITIALAGTIIFLLILKSWHVLAQSIVVTTRFPNSIMFEAAQRFRDELERLGREQSIFLIATLVFAVIFAITYLFPPLGMFEDLPQWQLILVLVLFGAKRLKNIGSDLGGAIKGFKQSMRDGEDDAAKSIEDKENGNVIDGEVTRHDKDKV
jgi:sec-independent protein translocase protein TatA